jgi:hypothetical protein
VGDGGLLEERREGECIIIFLLLQFYKLNLIYECPDGTFALAPPNYIVNQLLSIMEAAPDTCEHPVGFLTSEHRDSWYETRKKLIRGQETLSLSLPLSLSLSLPPSLSFFIFLCSSLRSHQQNNLGCH